MQLDVKALADAAAKIVREAVAPLEKRLADLEARPAPERGEKGDKGEDGPAGVGVAGAMIDRAGALILTLSDGTTKDLGPVVYEPFSLDDFDVEPLDERTIKLGFTKGEVMHSFELQFPVMIYRGAYRDGGTYERGDTVTWGGSLWHADKATSEKPDSGDWTLCAKRGRDGKDKA